MIRHISRRGADGNAVSSAALPLATYSYKDRRSHALGKVLDQLKAVPILSHTLYNVKDEILAWLYFDNY